MLNKKKDIDCEHLSETGNMGDFVNLKETWPWHDTPMFSSSAIDHEALALERERKYMRELWDKDPAMWKKRFDLILAGEPTWKKLIVDAQYSRLQEIDARIKYIEKNLFDYKEETMEPEPNTASETASINIDKVMRKVADIRGLFVLEGWVPAVKGYRVIREVYFDPQGEVENVIFDISR